MLSLVTHWARIDDTQLGRPKLSGQEEVNPLAVPMMVLYVIDEVCRDEERLQNIYSEDEEWAVQQILKHLQVLMSRSPWFWSKKVQGAGHTPWSATGYLVKVLFCAKNDRNTNVGTRVNLGVPKIEKGK